MPCWAGALPAASWLAGIANGGVLLYLSCTGFILLLSPTGTLPSPRWRWWARITAAGLAMAFLTAVLAPRPLYPEYPEIRNLMGVGALEHGLGAAIFPVGALLVLAGLVVGAVSLLLRFRRGRGLERPAAAVARPGGGAGGDGVRGLHDRPGHRGVGRLGLPGRPRDQHCRAAAGTGAAILRYRLYDIDRIISRTLAYALLTLLLGLGYAAVVLGFGRLLGQNSSLVVAAATLAVAAAFQPLRRRVQTLVDRRFNRRRYDAARTVEHFAARLRDQLDLHALHGELLAVVDQTMQPTHASLWLRPAPPSRR